MQGAGCRLEPVTGAWCQSLKLTHDQLLSNFAFDFDMRPSVMGGLDPSEQAALQR